jgi:NAD(P)-dependent dehydrogenase (short-subunit alcohol dehydrogenase family)
MLICPLNGLQIEREKGKLDVVFANAGSVRFGSLGRITEEDYDALFNANVKGSAFYGPEGAPANAGWRVSHLERVHCRQQRVSRMERL